MSTTALSFSLLLGAASFAAAQVTGTYPATPLASKTFSYPSGIPYKVDTDEGLIRGTQVGFNICNSTTETQDSLCQTSFFNDYNGFGFKISASGHPLNLAQSSPMLKARWWLGVGHGTRLIPDGALTGLQFLKTPDFIQVVGFIDQSKINMASNDSGGEMDPHGADLRGNPMGGIMFSNVWTGEYQQVIEWTNFMGNNAFCLKACDPAGANAAQWCQHIYDRIGCTYNAPNAAQNNVFESCDAESGDFPGVYTSDGVTVTYTQPAESLGAISTIPFTARIPSSSNCVTYTSEAIFTGFPTVQVTSSGASESETGSASGVKATGSASASTSAKSASASGGASVLAISGLSVLGVVFSAIFLS